MKCLKHILSILLIMIISSQAHATDVPGIINYRGSLETAQGDGRYGVAFRIYDNDSLDSSGLVWSRFVNVNVENGCFNVLLSNDAKLVDGDSPSVNNLGYAFGGSERYLKLTILTYNDNPIDNPPDIPTQRITSIPYAFNAFNGVPVGTILAFGGIVGNIPEGWELCDGRALSSQEYKYEALYNAIATAWGDGTSGDLANPPTTDFNLPDLQGMFLRGAGSHGTQTMASGDSFSGGNVGLFDSDKLQGHLHTMNVRMASGYSGGGSVTSGDFHSTESFTSFFGASSHAIGPLSSYGSPRVGYETKPASYSVLYIIKY